MAEMILAAINASYTHSNLAIRYLHKIATEAEITAEIIEFTINDQVVKVADRLIHFSPKVIGFSCYIWNIEMVLKVVERVKLACPETLIILGGPEVINCDRNWMNEHPLVDMVQVGPGEYAFAIWCKNYQNKKWDYTQVPNLYWRNSEGDIIFNYVNNREGIIGEGYHREENFQHRLVYYETSRGCAYHCAYCLSSLDKRVYYRDLHQVKYDLKKLAFSGAKTVKLVDRTFNLNEKRARSIIDYWCSLEADCCLHAEVVADIVSDDFCKYLTELPAGRIQFEIGIQSVNQEALQAVNRKSNWQRAAEVISKLTAAGNIHIHLDLLVGLPNEDLVSFSNSFNSVYSLKPNHLQVGMLKILPGTLMKKLADDYGYKYSSFPPYEIISNSWLSPVQIVQLHHLADTIDRLYNHQDLRIVHDYIAAKFPSLFDYWMELAEIAWDQGLLNSAQKSDNWAYLPVLLAKKHCPQLVAEVEDRVHLALLLRERRYHFQAPFTDSGITDQEFNGYREWVIARWPHLRDMSIKELKRRVAIHRLKTLADTTASQGLAAFLYTQEGLPCLDYFVW